MLTSVNKIFSCFSTGKEWEEYFNRISRSRHLRLDSFKWWGISIARYWSSINLTITSLSSVSMINFFLPAFTCNFYLISDAKTKRKENCLLFQIQEIYVMLLLPNCLQLYNKLQHDAEDYPEYTDACIMLEKFCVFAAELAHLCERG